MCLFMSPSSTPLFMRVPTTLRLAPVRLRHLHSDNGSFRQRSCRYQAPLCRPQRPASRLESPLSSHRTSLRQAIIRSRLPRRSPHRLLPFLASTKTPPDRCVDRQERRLEETLATLLQGSRRGGVNRRGREKIGAAGETSLHLHYDGNSAAGHLAGREAFL